MVLKEPERIERELELFANSAVNLFLDNASVKVSILDDASINACVEKRDGIYYIGITDGVFSFLATLLEDVYFKDITDDDLLKYQFFASDGLYVLFDDSSLKNSFMATIARIICFNLLYHECGHIVNEHCENGDNNQEYYNETSKIGYGHQARELIADFWGIRMCFRVFVYSFGKEYSYKLSDIKDFELMRKCLVTEFISLFILYNLFDRNIAEGQNKYDENTLRNRSHPHPYVRLLYGLDVAREGLMEIIEENNNTVSPDDSEKIVNDIISYALDDYNALLNKMHIKQIVDKMTEPAVVETYIKIRKKATKQSRKHSEFSKFEVIKLSEEYINQIRSVKGKKTPHN